MLNCIFYSLIFTLFLTVSFGSLRYSQINRIFMSMYRGLFESSVNTIDDNGEPIMPYYNEPILEKYVDEFLNQNLKKYCKSYVFSINYEPNSIVNDSLYRSVSINLKADINYLFTYDNSQTFLIESRDSI